MLAKRRKHQQCKSVQDPVAFSPVLNVFQKKHSEETSDEENCIKTFEELYKDCVLLDVTTAM